MPPDPPSISMLCMLIVLRTIYTIAINQDPPLGKFWIRPWWQYVNISPNYLCYIFIFEFYPGKAYEIIMRLSLLSPTYPRSGYRWGFVGDLSPKFVPRVGAFVQLLYKY